MGVDPVRHRIHTIGISVAYREALHHRLGQTLAHALSAVSISAMYSSPLETTSIAA